MKNGLIVLVAKEKYFTILFEINKVPVYQKECVKHLDACQKICVNHRWATVMAWG